MASRGRAKSVCCPSWTVGTRTCLTNGFSKKLENHAAAGALQYMHYNFVRIHRTLRVTPAMQAGLSARVWSIEDIIGLPEIAEKEPAA